MPGWGFDEGRRGRGSAGWEAGFITIRTTLGPLLRFSCPDVNLVRFAAAHPGELMCKLMFLGLMKYERGLCGFT